MGQCEKQSERHYLLKKRAADDAAALGKEVLQDPETSVNDGECRRCGRATPSTTTRIMHHLTTHPFPLDAEWRLAYESLEDAVRLAIGDGVRAHTIRPLNLSGVIRAKMHAFAHWAAVYLNPAGDWKLEPFDFSEVSDGYHTFGELYEHRHRLFILLLWSHPDRSWRSRKHSDGSEIEGWFLAGMSLEDGPFTYHMPLRFWDELDDSGVITFQKAPEWDGHTPADVLDRLKGGF